MKTVFTNLLKASLAMVAGWTFAAWMLLSLASLLTSLA